MDQESTKRGLLQGIIQRLAALAPGRGRSADGSRAEADRGLDPLAVFEQVQSGRRPDYCLYVGPTKVKPAGPGAADMEDLIARGFAPLPFLPIDGYKSPLRRLPTEGRLGEEAFAALATHARVLLVVPTTNPQTIARLRWLKEHGHLWRTVFFMPDAGALGTDDWSAAWESARQGIASIGLDLPPYTAGGWLFRYAIEPTGLRAATFRMIVHPNPEKIAKALEGICEEMTP